MWTPLLRWLRGSKAKRRQPNRKQRLEFEALESRFAPATDVLTFHNDLPSSGVNATETQLTPTNVVVNTFGKLHTIAVDGQVYAKPLVKTGVTIADGPHTLAGAGGTFDVVFVATQHNSLYAIDAGGNSADVLWHRSFLDISIPSNNALGATAITPVPSEDTGTADISPEVGITGTPVIDGETGVLYVVVKTKQIINGADHYVQRLHAIDIHNGSDRVDPYLIGDTSDSDNTQIYVYGTGHGSIIDPYNGTQQLVVPFNALRENQRPALNLVHDEVYVCWASHADNGPYHGLVVKWDVSRLDTHGLVLSGVLNTSPNDGLSGIWQSAGKLAFEPDGSAFYFETGNGVGGAPVLNAAGFPADANYNEALVKVVADPTTHPAQQNANGWGMKIVDFFIPFNAVALDGVDSDFGSGAPIVLPDSAGIPGHPRLLIAGGKEGKLYLVDRDNLGGFDSNQDRVLNSVPDGSGHLSPSAAISGLLSTPVWFNDKLYVLGGYGDGAYAFSVNDDATLSADSQTVINNFGYLPGSPVVSANGTSHGILWVMDRQRNQLHAYDAATLSTELWNSGQKIGGGDNVGAVVKFAAPTVANGRVYVGTLNSLVIYGLIQPPDAAPEAPTLSASPISGTAVRLTWSDPTLSPNTAGSYLIEKSTDGISFEAAATALGGTTALAVGGLQPLTHYYFRITGVNDLGDSAPSNVAETDTTDQTALLDYSGGFANAAGLTFNGSARISGGRMELTSNDPDESGSVFSTELVDITAFTSKFTFQVTPENPGDPLADGLTFTLQRGAASARGGSGGSLGYAGINHSVAIKFDLFDNAGEGSNSTGIYVNGELPYNLGAIDLTPLDLDLHSGHVFQVEATYNGTTLTVTITDTTTLQSTTQSFLVDLPSIVGDNSAYVGFTGGTGGLTALQEILTWTYSPSATASPNPPSGLGATAASAISIRLSWTANATNQLGYHLDRATDANFTHEVVHATLPAHVVSFIDTAIGLAPGGTYYYRLRAFNSVGDSDHSNVTQVTIPLAPPKPSDQRVDAVTTNAIHLSWQDNAGHQADGYKVLRSINHGPFAQVATTPPTSRTPPSRYEWTDEGLPSGSFVEYHIVAFNVSGNNDFAGTNATTITDAPSAPSAVASSGAIVLSWTAPPGAESFNIYRGVSAAGGGPTPYVIGVVGTSYVDEDVNVGTTYYYTITAVNANRERVPELPAESESSAEVSAQAIASVAAAGNVTVTAPTNRTAAQAILQWHAPFGALHHNIYRSTQPNGPNMLLASSVTASTYLDTTVVFGRTYYYQVAAVNETGEGPLSEPVSVQPQLHVQVNFTSTAGDAVAGYVADRGDLLGVRDDGLTFGWNRADAVNGVDRDAPNSPNEPRDSFHEMRPVGSTNANWRIVVPNGDYAIHVVLGDPSDVSSAYRVQITDGSGSGVSVSGKATAASPWLEKTITLKVTHGLIVVQNPRGVALNKLAAIDIVALPPAITKFSPAVGKIGTKVVVTGANLTGVTSVQIDGRDAIFKSLSATKLQIVVPTGATIGPITVSTLGGTVVSSGIFIPAPRLDSFSPATGARGSVVVLQGANFSTVKTVSVRGYKATFVVDSDTQITLTVPIKAKTGRIQVVTSAGKAVSAADFIVVGA